LTEKALEEQGKEEGNIKHKIENSIIIAINRTHSVDEAG